MAMNDAACDVFCQQFGEESYEKVFACLFPRAFAKYRYQDFLFENSADDHRETSAEPFEILIAADWFDEVGDCESAELMRLSVEWNFEPPSPELNTLAEQIRNERIGFWRWTLKNMETQVMTAIEAVFTQYQP